jgi:hypothetical protein
VEEPGALEMAALVQSRAPVFTEKASMRSGLGGFETRTKRRDRALTIMLAFLREREAGVPQLESIEPLLARRTRPLPRVANQPLLPSATAELGLEPARKRNEPVRAEISAAP